MFFRYKYTQLIRHILINLTLAKIDEVCVIDTIKSSGDYHGQADSIKCYYLFDFKNKKLYMDLSLTFRKALFITVHFNDSSEFIIKDLPHEQNLIKINLHNQNGQIRADIQNENSARYTLLIIGLIVILAMIVDSPIIYIIILLSKFLIFLWILKPHEKELLFLKWFISQVIGVITAYFLSNWLEPYGSLKIFTLLTIVIDIIMLIIIPFGNYRRIVISIIIGNLIFLIIGLISIGMFKWF